MSAIKCVNCKKAMKKVTGVNRLFCDRYMISGTRLYVCSTCGEEYLDAGEYERIRKKIDAIETKTSIPQYTK